MPSPSALFASMFFGIVGFAAFIYARNTRTWHPLVIGIALMVFPYFIEQTWLLYTIGCALCAGLFVFRG